MGSTKMMNPKPSSVQNLSFMILLLLLTILQQSHQLMATAPYVSPAPSPTADPCAYKCYVRCGRSWKPEMCNHLCNVCCSKCGIKCVPASHDAPRESACSCYANLKNPKTGKNKCP